jgi:antitoxin ParD1/3/4
MCARFGDGTMKTLSVSLPEAMIKFIENIVQKEKFESPSAYLQMLISEAQKREAGIMLERMVLEGLNSGAAVEVDEAFWKNRRDELEGHLENKTSS